MQPSTGHVLIIKIFTKNFFADRHKAAEFVKIISLEKKTLYGIVTTRVHRFLFSTAAEAKKAVREGLGTRLCLQCQATLLGEL